jgi:hypothetical protein
MGALSKKLRSVEGGGLMFRCPGCNEPHMVRVGEGPSPRWLYNNDPERPTFAPSILVRGIAAPDGTEMTEAEEAEYDAILAKGGVEAAFASRFGTCCHSFVEEGRIKFLGDCTHALVSQTVDLPDWPET